MENFEVGSLRGGAEGRWLRPGGAGRPPPNPRFFAMLTALRRPLSRPAGGLLRQQGSPAHLHSQCVRQQRWLEEGEGKRRDECWAGGLNPAACPPLPACVAAPWFNDDRIDDLKKFAGE